MSTTGNQQDKARAEKLLMEATQKQKAQNAAKLAKEAQEKEVREKVAREKVIAANQTSKDSMLTSTAKTVVGVINPWTAQSVIAGTFDEDGNQRTPGLTAPIDNFLDIFSFEGVTVGLPQLAFNTAETLFNAAADKVSGRSNKAAPPVTLDEGPPPVVSAAGFSDNGRTGGHGLTHHTQRRRPPAGRDPSGSRNT